MSVEIGAQVHAPIIGRTGQVRSIQKMAKPAVACLAKHPDTARMSNRIRELRRSADLTQAQLAEIVDADVTTIHKLEAGKMRLSQKWLEAIAAALDVAPGDLLPPHSPAASDANRRSSRPRGDVDLENIVTEGVVGARDLPVYASAQGGQGQTIISYEPIEIVRRPAPLEGVRGGFAMYVVGDSMEPVYRQGDMVLVHPTKPVAAGDDVLVVMTGESDGWHDAMIKRLRSMADRVVRLAQYNPPDDTIEVPRETVRGIHLIVGSYKRR